MWLIIHANYWSSARIFRVFAIRVKNAAMFLHFIANE
jgi:hypothetical protein